MEHVAQEAEILRTAAADDDCGPRRTSLGRSPGCGHLQSQGRLLDQGDEGLQEARALRAVVLRLIVV
jgi:hypothetical protein